MLAAYDVIAKAYDVVIVTDDVLKRVVRIERNVAASSLIDAMLKVKKSLSAGEMVWTACEAH